MSSIKSYKELIVWQKSISLVKEIYKLTNNFPQSEIYGLSSQMRRAAVSIPSNIAEGYARKSSREYSQFYSIAYGSLLELETQLTIARDLKFGNINSYNDIESLVNEVSRMLHVMIIKIGQLNPKR
ncbi:MAG: four helix bundle protein [Candidatus Levybacteria bacterium CG_4_10_14_0_2_um_filter_36_16]|nr:MAG: hypothetical protein AUK12_02515 [Candidatus Levybacteria bacterium CG2_30_37_29]PIR79499.1 MAG: four helix bundle protein [Candidatus Levybacteria bacterium CG10_big_fil_rev_8_21_14_0_10_36_30]PIZ97513.1 MAG: four helix bundle protein [Candidatus Levybacteria bacterium CG_4_10_14_0_2_um_filter_36_16]